MECWLEFIDHHGELRYIADFSWAHDVGQQTSIRSYNSVEVPILVSMRSLYIFAFTGMATAATITTCAANNCLRAIRATAFTTRSAAADCSAYQTTYAQPLTTVTVTADISADPTFNNGPKTIPNYASACSGGEAAYRSACSCIGHPSALIQTVTATRVSVAPPACSTFALKASSGSYAGKFFVLSYGRFYLSGNTVESAAKFAYKNSRFVDPTNERVVLEESALFDTDYLTFGSGSSSLACDIAAEPSYAVTCTIPNTTKNTFQLGRGTYDSVLFGKDQSAGSSIYTVFEVQAVPAC